VGRIAEQTHGVLSHVLHVELAHPCTMQNLSLVSLLCVCICVLRYAQLLSSPGNKGRVSQEERMTLERLLWKTARKIGFSRWTEPWSGRENKSHPTTGVPTCEHSSRNTRRHTTKYLTRDDNTHQNKPKHTWNLDNITCRPNKSSSSRRVVSWVRRRGQIPKYQLI